MNADSPRAITVALPLAQSLQVRPFAGVVTGRFARSCELTDREGRIIALTLPAIGNGPFTIVLAGEAGLFEAAQIDQPALVDGGRIMLGDWCILLSEASIWDASLPELTGLELTPAIAALLQACCPWPAPAANTPLSRMISEALRTGALALNEALVRGVDLAPPARQLAGLGQGLTPAGDDYLLGAMAALWLLGQRGRAALIAQSAAPLTTALGAAFLRAAAQGQFAEAWQQLARALSLQSEPACREAIATIAASGASSGRDALAGFATSLLALLASRRPRPLRNGALY